MGTAGDVLETTPLSDALRRLWTDHVIWTRQYIVAALAGSPDAEAAAGRLLRNQEDIGNAIVPLYGAEAGEELTRLLKEHILIAVDLVAAAIKGDKRAFARHDKRWDANADDIAAFLAGANPNWPEDDVRDLLAQHLSLTRGRRSPGSRRTGPPTSPPSTTSSPRSSPWRTPSRTASWRSSPSDSGPRATVTLPATASRSWKRRPP